MSNTGGATAEVSRSDDFSRVSRPVSDGWYAKRRDQAQATLAAPAGNQPAAAVDPSALPTAKPTQEVGVNSPPPAHRAAIQAQPLTPAASQVRAAESAAAQSTPAGTGNRVLLEWTRSAEEPLRSGGDLTGMAMNDRQTLQR
jgi:hypothetical protein